jgi:phage shock protein PspC (stress-responsive transcriptional regulator)
MQRVITVGLTGHDRQFRLHEDAYDALRQYLDQAGARLGEDPDRAEVVGDLERSIGDRLAALAGPGDRVLEAGDIGAVLEEVGAVEVGAGTPSAAAVPVGAVARPPKRRLYRIRQGQSFAGVCNGLAAYSDIDVAWVRTIFFFATLVTAGGFLLVYLVMMFILPVVGTREEWYAALAEADAVRGS